MRGMFGEITLREDGVTRALLINRQVQGSLFLRPDASEIDPELSGPIVSASAYAHGWLLAGTQSPSGSGLMVGLGSGGGALNLLANFPDIDLTVVEIDPAVVSVAFKGFPALEQYLNKGRLNVVISDAKAYLGEHSHKFDFGLADAYTGKGQKHVVSYHALLKERCKDVYFNIIDSTDLELVKATKETFADLGMPLRWLMRALPPELLKSPAVHTSNWIVTSSDVNWRLADDFEPFPKLEGPEIDWTRICWNALIASPQRL